MHFGALPIAYAKVFVHFRFETASFIETHSENSFKNFPLAKIWQLPGVFFFLENGCFEELGRLVC